MIYGAMALLGAGTSNSGVSNIAHLGGMIFGLIYLKARFPKLDAYEVRRWYRQLQTTAQQEEIPGLHAKARLGPRSVGATEAAAQFLTPV